MCWEGIVYWVVIQNKMYPWNNEEYEGRRLVGSRESLSQINHGPLTIWLAVISVKSSNCQW